MSEEKPVDSDAVPQPEGPKKKTLLMCPCCHKETLEPPLKIQGELLDHFMSCMLAGIPYTREYAIYKDRLYVTAVMPSRETNLLMQKLSIRCQALTGMFPEKEQTLRAIGLAVDQYVMIQEIRIKTGDTSKVFRPAEHVIKIAKDLVASVVTKEKPIDFEELLTLTAAPDSVSAVPIRTLMAVSTAHANLYETLIGAGFDENFWDGIVLV